MALTARQIETLNTPGMYSDGSTLFLRVAPGGSKQWVQRITIRGRRRDMGLGGYPVVTLAEAREAAFANRKLARAGGDPIAEKNKEQAPTFRGASISTFAMLAPRWKSRKVAANWKQQLERHAMRRLGSLPVDTIGREDILRVLTPIWTATPETGRRVRRYIRQTLDWCVSQGFCDVNMAGDVLNGALPKQPAVKSHHRALPYGELPEVWSAFDGSTTAALALRFAILTAVRSGEARGATWAEIDLDRREWRIPGERMKQQSEHRVPLSQAALDVLERARPLADGSGLVFPSGRVQGRSLSDATLRKVLSEAGLADRATA